MNHRKKMKKRNNQKVFLIFVLGLVIVNCSAMSEETAFKYESRGRRDPFVPLVGVAGVGTVGGLHGVSSIDDISFQGVVLSPDGKKAAIINGEIFKEGDIIGRVQVVSVGENEVTLKIDERTHRLTLYE